MSHDPLLAWINDALATLKGREDQSVNAGGAVMPSTGPDGSEAFVQLTGHPQTGIKREFLRRLRSCSRQLYKDLKREYPGDEPATVGELARMLEDCRDELLGKAGEAEPAANTQAESAAIRVLLGDAGSAILPIAEDSELSVEGKMRRIALLMPATTAWKATQWAALLNVSDSRIRQQAVWKTWRETEKNPD